MHPRPSRTACRPDVPDLFLGERTCPCSRNMLEGPNLGLLWNVQGSVPNAEIVIPTPHILLPRPRPVSTLRDRGKCTNHVRAICQVAPSSHPLPSNFMAPNPTFAINYHLQDKTTNPDKGKKSRIAMSARQYRALTLGLAGLRASRRSANHVAPGRWR